MEHGLNYITLYVQKHIASLAMCYNPSLVRDKPLGAPIFVKLVYSEGEEGNISATIRRSFRATQNIPKTLVSNIWNFKQLGQSELRIMTDRFEIEHWLVTNHFKSEVKISAIVIFEPTRRCEEPSANIVVAANLAKIFNLPAKKVPVAMRNIKVHNKVLTPWQWVT